MDDIIFVFLEGCKGGYKQPEREIHGKEIVSNWLHPEL